MKIRVKKHKKYVADFILNLHKSIVDDVMNTSNYDRKNIEFRKSLIKKYRRRLRVLNY